MIDIDKGRYWDLPWSLVLGCTPCSPGCENCWALAMEKRFHRNEMKGIAIHPGHLSVPMKRNKPAVYAVWNDFFHEAVPDTFRDEAYSTMLGINDHRYLILTKRPGQALEYFNSRRFPEGIREHIWHGLTVCNQQEADEKIPIFLKVPVKKFLSIEPLLGPIDITMALEAFQPLNPDLSRKPSPVDAVILGGETGAGARPMHPDWVRTIRDQCATAGVAFFFKGWGAWRPCDDDHVECGGHKQTAMRISGKIVTDTWKDSGLGGSDQGFWRAGAKAGRLLDGRTHDDLPWRS